MPVIFHLPYWPTGYTGSHDGTSSLMKLMNHWNTNEYFPPCNSFVKSTCPLFRDWPRHLCTLFISRFGRQRKVGMFGKLFLKHMFSRSANIVESARDEGSWGAETVAPSSSSSIPLFISISFSNSAANYAVFESMACSSMPPAHRHFSTSTHSSRATSEESIMSE